MVAEYGYRKIIEIFHHYSYEVENGGFCLRIKVTQKSLEDIDSLKASGVEFDRFVLDQAYDREDLCHLDGKELKAYLSYKSLGRAGYNIFQDWDHYLSYRENKLTPKDTFLILKDGDLFPYEKDRASRLKNYLKVLEFIKLLDQLSELDSIMSPATKLSVSFIHKGRTDISIDYSSYDLDNDLDGFEALEKIFSSDKHEEQRNRIFVETIFSFTFSQKSQARFSYLLSHMFEFSSQFMENYNLFISEFSLEKVRREYEEKKREYISKINEVISSVHTRMLGIPAVLVLASFRFSEKASGSDVFGNLIILVAVLTYALMMHYLIKSQKDTLITIRGEAEKHIERIGEKDWPKEVEEIKQVSKSIMDKCDKECRRLNIFYFMMLMLMVAVLVLVFQSFGIIDWTPGGESLQEGEKARWALPSLGYT